MSPGHELFAAARERFAGTRSGPFLDMSARALLFDEGRAALDRHLDDMANGTVDKAGLFLTDKIRIYQIDPDKFELNEAAQAIGKQADAFRGELQAMVQSGNENAPHHLKFIDAARGPSVPTQFLLITAEPSDKAWNADGERTVEQMDINSLGYPPTVPHIPYARMSVLVPRGVPMRGIDVFLAGVLPLTERDSPRRAACSALTSAPKWIATACDANYAERQIGDGPRSQNGFGGFVAGDATMLRAAVRRLAAGLTDNVWSKEEAGKKRGKQDDPAFGGMIRVL